jgi:hypothetical protein
MKPTTEKQFEHALAGAIAASASDEMADELGMSHGEAFSMRLESFKDAGILTTNRGLVVHLPNGDEYQVTIVKSNTARTNAEQEEEAEDDEPAECPNCGVEWDEQYAGQWRGKCRECGHTLGEEVYDVAD